MNGHGIILARSAATLKPCVGCQRPAPQEQLGGGILCGACWVRIGVQAGWVLEPAVPGLNMSVRLLLVGELMAHQGSHGHVEDPLMCLRRLLHERAVMLGLRASGVVVATCAYCGHEPVAAEDAERLPDVEGQLPVIRCVDRAACGGRVREQVQARAATAGQVPS